MTSVAAMAGTVVARTPATNGSAPSRHTSAARTAAPPIRRATAHRRCVIACLPAGVYGTPLRWVQRSRRVRHVSERPRHEGGGVVPAGQRRAAFAGGSAQPRPEGRVGEPRAERLREGGAVVRRHEHAWQLAGSRRAQRLSNPSHVGGQHRDSPGQRLGGHHAEGLVARREDEQVGGGVRRLERGSGQGPGPPHPVGEAGRLDGGRQAGCVLGVERGADARPGPGQVRQSRQRLDQDVVALDRRDGADAEQARAGAGCSGERGGIGAGSGDVQDAVGQVIRGAQPVAGPGAGADDRAGGAQRAGLLLAPGRLTREVDSQRQVHEHHQPQPVRLGLDRRRRRAPDEPVDQHHGPVGQPRQHRPEPGDLGGVETHVPAQVAQRRPRRAGHRRCHRSVASGRRRRAARRSGARSRDQRVRSKLAQATCDSCSVTRIRSRPWAGSPSSPARTRSAIRSATTRASASVEVFMPAKSSSSSRLR